MESYQPRQVYIYITQPPYTQHTRRTTVFRNGSNYLQTSVPSSKCPHAYDPSIWISIPQYLRHKHPVPCAHVHVHR